MKGSSVKATIALNLTTTSPEEAQELLRALCRSLASGGLVSAWDYEIQTESGMVTDRCMLSQGKVVA